MNSRTPIPLLTVIASLVAAGSAPFVNSQVPGGLGDDLEGASAPIQFVQFSGGGGEDGGMMITPDAYGGYGGSAGRSWSGSLPPLNLRFSDLPESSATELNEDLAVMTRLLENALDRAAGSGGPDYRMGIPMTFSSGGRSARSIYLEGFGALFMIKQNLPLAGKAKPETKAEPPAKETEWQKTRRELAGLPAPELRDASLAGPRFDSRLVAAIEETLARTLAQATNIRHLRAEESVAVTVFGPADEAAVVYGGMGAGGFGGGMPEGFPGYGPGGGGGGLGGSSSFGGAGGLGGGGGFGGGYAGSGASGAGMGGPGIGYVAPTGSRGTVMTLRASKSDVDAFAKGTLDLESFMKKVRVHRYSGAGHDLKSLNSWTAPSSN